MKYLSDFNNSQESCISSKLNHTILLWWPFPLVLRAFATNYLEQEFRSKVWVLLSIILLARTVGQIVLPIRLSPFLFDKYSHKSETALWILCWLIEIIVRKTVSIVSPSAQKCRDNFLFFLLLSIPRDNGIVAPKTGCPLSLNFDHHQFSDSVPFSLWSFVVSRVPLLFWSRSKERPTSCWKSFANKDTNVALAIHSCSLFLVLHMMSLNIDMKIIRPWNCAGSLILFMNSLTSSTSCNVVNPGKICHSNSIGSPSIVSKVLCCGEYLWTNSIFFPNSIWCWVLIHLSKTQHRIWKYVNLCKRETDDFFTTDHRQLFPWRIFPADLRHSKNLIWLYHYQLFRYVEHLLLSEIFTCPNHRTFVDVLHCIFWRMVRYLLQSIIHHVQEWSWS